MKKNIVLILLIIMLISMFSQAYAAQISDIGGHWGREDIQYLLDRGIVQGHNGKYRPEDPITRAEFVTIMNKALGLQELGQVKFNDVKQGVWYYNEIAKAMKVGYIHGFSETQFGPNEDITRQDAATIVGRAFGFEEVNNPSNKFNDHNSIRSHAEGFIYALVQKGYVSGYDRDHTFRPLNSITRAEAATIVAKTIKGEGIEVPPLPEQEINKITGIKYLGSNKVEVNSTGKLQYEKMTLTDPHRIVLDFYDIKLDVSDSKINPNDNGFIKEVRYSQHPDKTRVTFEVTENLTITNSSNDISTIFTIKKPTIVVDPGHGGTDPGALGVEGSGLREKDIALSVSLKLESELKKLGYNVVMTRKSDITMELAERTSMANKINADIFVSIHTNSFTDSSARGIETYSFPGSVNGAALAKSIHDEVIKDKTLFTVDRGTKTANFHVLRETKMPSALIELGFIKNSQDAEILINKQEAFAKAIAKGIDNYFK